MEAILKGSSQRGWKTTTSTVNDPEVVSDAVSVTIGQQIRREGKEEFWDSLLVECKEQGDGSLTVDVVVFHPRWDEPLRIASIQSHPSDGNAAEPTLRCDFEQKRL